MLLYRLWHASSNEKRAPIPAALFEDNNLVSTLRISRARAGSPLSDCISFMLVHFYGNAGWGDVVHACAGNVSRADCNCKMNARSHTSRQGRPLQPSVAAVRAMLRLQLDYACLE